MKDLLAMQAMTDKANANCSASLPGTSRWLLTPLILSLLVHTTFLQSISTGQEQAEKFVSQLRSAGFHEITLSYLNRISEYPGVPQAFLEAIDLERAETLVAAATNSRVMAQRDAYNTQASEALTRFVTQYPDHPRRPQAQLQLGNLQLLRGRELLESGGEVDESRRTSARQAFTGAVQTFEAIVADLKEKLLAMQGEKIDANAEPEKLALRDRYRREYLQALLAGGDAMKRAGDTFIDVSPERDKWYDDSLARFTKLSDEHSDTLAGILATLYSGQVHQAKRDTPLAKERYAAVLDQTDADVLRIPKVKAAIGMMQLEMAESPAKWQAAIDFGQPWADNIRPNERQMPEFQELRLVLADAYIGLVADTEKPGDQRKYTNAVRDLLQPLARSEGPLQRIANEKLAKLGATPATSDPQIDLANLPATFAESMVIANKIVDDERSMSLTTELISQRVESGENLKEELEKARSELLETRARGVQVLRHTLSKATSEIDPNEVNAARYALAYLLHNSGQHRQAAVVGEFVARHFPNNERAADCCQLAMTSWQLALREATPEQTEGVISQLRRTSQLLVDGWPDVPAAAIARELLIRVAISRGEIDEAAKALQALPADYGARAELQRALGSAMWNKALSRQKEGDVEGANAIRTQAITTLTSTLSALEAPNVSAGDLETALLLARVQMMNDDAPAAMETLDNSTYGPLQRATDIVVENDEFKGQLYAIALQVLVAQLTTDGSDASTLLSRAAEAMTGLQEAYAGQADGEKRLIATYFRLAGDIRNQLDAAPPEKKAKLTDGFKMFLDQLASTTDDAKTLHWAAQTLLELGQGQITEGQARASGQAESLIKSSVGLLQRLETQGAKDPPWIGGETVLRQVRLELAKAARLTGDYKKAIDVLTEVLTEQNTLVDAQVEAALAYEQWAAVLAPKYAPLSYERAMIGAKPDPKTRRNILWGWGSIAKRTMGQEAFESIFFDARYHLALCRYLKGKKTTEGGNAKKLIEQASEDIRNVLVRYPDMGGNLSRQRFDLLLKEIQKSLGKTPNGLAEFMTPIESSP